jgi:hypothetical protein
MPSVRQTDGGARDADPSIRRCRVSHREAHRRRGRLPHGARTRRAATYAAVLFFAEMAIGVLMQAFGFSTVLGAFYVLAAVGVFAFLVVVTVRAGSKTTP